MNNVRQMLRSKGNEVWSISKDDSVLEALKLMGEKKIGALVVLESDELVGIFTERDYARKVGVIDKKPGEVSIQEVMTKDLITVQPGQSVRECMDLMTDNRVRHLPVLDQGTLVGIISIGDVVKDLIEELQFLVKQMENYIMGLR